MQRLVLLCCFMCFTHPAWSLPITNLVVIGDSLSDTGNLFAIANHPSSPPYFEGRFSNGPTFVEYVNEALGLDPLLPAVMGGSNYAWGGARAGFDLPISGGAIPGALTQTLAYLQGQPVIEPSTLFSIFIGNNDVADAIDINLDLIQAQPMFENTIAQVIQSISLLHSQGATQFIVPLVPDWSKAPKYFNNPRAAELTELYNLLYSTALSNLNFEVNIFDTGDVFNSNQHLFANRNTPCLANGCQTPEDFLFFDDVHPTTRAHALLANTMVTAIPNVSTDWFMLIGLVLVWIRRKLNPSPYRALAG